MLVHEKTGKRRYKDAEENEVLHVFELGIVGELAAELELAREGVDIDELAQARIRLVPTANASVLSNADQTWDGDPHELGLQDMARYLLLQQSARGGEISNLAGVPHRRCKWSEVPAQWFQWSTALSVPWRQRAHINICEAMARHLSLRQRARQPSLHHQRFLHLMDSQVNSNVASKGRSGSRRMSHAQRKSSGVLLACNLRDVNGYTSSKANPADKASRDKRRWGRYRRALAIRHKLQDKVSRSAATSARQRQRPEARPAP